MCIVLQRLPVFSPDNDDDDDDDIDEYDDDDDDGGGDDSHAELCIALSPGLFT